jgi:hypothetical protein
MALRVAAACQRIKHVFDRRVAGQRISPGEQVNNKRVTPELKGYFFSMSAVATDERPMGLSEVWSNVLLGRHASLKCSGIEHAID